MSVVIKRRLEWDSAHRVMRHESKCSTLHGHRYAAEIHVTADKLDGCDRVIDFGVVKARVGAWIDEHWDHATLVNREDEDLVRFCEDDHRLRGRKAPWAFSAEPTAETIAAELLSIASTLLRVTGVRVVAVEVWETPNCSARATREVSP